MKKSFSLIWVIVLFLVSSLIFCEPVNASEPDVINVSELEDGSSLVIYSDSILNLDTDKILSRIVIMSNNLTIEGNGTLTLETEDTTGIFIYSSGEVTVNSGSIISNSSFSGNFVINGGTIKLSDGIISSNYKDNGYFTMNGGEVYAECINYSYGDSTITINNGYLECKTVCVAKKINIDESELIVFPWKSTPTAYFNSDLSMIYHGSVLTDAKDEWHEDSKSYSHSCSYSTLIKIMPKSDITYVDGISLNNESSYTITRREPKQLSVIISPESATNKKINWSSSDNYIARVDERGIVFGNHPGTAIITATSEDGNYSVSCEITVSEETTD